MEAEERARKEAEERARKQAEERARKQALQHANEERDRAQQGLEVAQQAMLRMGRGQDREDQVDGVPTISTEDIDRHGDAIASGSFKDVYRAQLRKEVAAVGKAGLEVAVIQFRNGTSTLAAELDVFKKLGRHPNLTRLLAVTRSDEGSVTSLVTEFAKLGSLDQVLVLAEERDERATSQVLLTAAMQALDGMMQLVEHRIVHRDVALRNLLVFDFDLEDCSRVKVKLTDYGLSAMGTYVQKSTSSVGDGVPFRWMSPEAIQKHRWSEKSDVWAFAVTVWEMFTHGMVPYHLISSDSEVASRVIAGARLERPLSPCECPEGVFAILQRCWAGRAADRPTFADVKHLMMEVVKVEREGDCCICMERMPIQRLLAIVPCGHRCVCAEDAHHVVGKACPVCRTPATEAIRVFDSG